VITQGLRVRGRGGRFILTEEDYFGGSLDDLRAVRKHGLASDSAQDFVFDEYQVYDRPPRPLMQCC